MDEGDNSQHRTLPRVVSRETSRLSPFVTLVRREVEVEGGSGTHVFHSLAQADYVAVVARGPDGRIATVEQYRPVIERMTLELPAGLRDADEDPAEAAARELWEETGLRGEAFELLGRVPADTGRLENSLWVFYVDGVVPGEGWTAEDGLAARLQTPSDLARAVASGDFANGLHVAALGLAMLHGRIPELHGCLASG